MTLEMMSRIISGKLLLDFCLIFLVFLTENLINFKLIFEIVGVKVKIRQILSAVLLLNLYNIGMKPILPGLAYGLILSLLLVLLVKMIGKNSISWLQTFWCVFLTFSITVLGVVAFQIPLLLNREIASFIMKAPIGAAIGSAFEMIGPLVVFYLIRTFKFSLIPFSGKKVTRLDFWWLCLFGIMFIMLYCMIVIFVMCLKYGPQLALAIISTVIWILMIGEVVIYHIIRTLTHREHENQQRMHEENLALMEKYNQDKITKLEDQNRELKLLMEYLKMNNSEEIKEIKESIRRMESNNNKAIHQIQSSSSVEEDMGEPRNDESGKKVESFPKADLSETEIQLLRLIALEKNTKEIAAEMHLSPHSVKKYITNLNAKLGTHDRVQLAMYALRENIMTKKEAGL